ITAERAESDAASRWPLAVAEAHPFVIHHDNLAVTFNGRPLGREIERHYVDALGEDVRPHVEFGPVGQREDTQCFARRQVAIVEMPQLRPLSFWLPAMARAAHRENAFLRARALLVAARATNREIVPTFGQGLLQSVGL